MVDFLITLLILLVLELFLIIGWCKSAYNYLYSDNITYSRGLGRILAYIYKNFKEDLWIPIIIVIFVDIIIATFIQLILSIFL